MPRLGPALAAALIAVSAPAFGTAAGAAPDPFAVPAPNGERPLSIPLKAACRSDASA
jgi:hypothetical protein